MGSPISSTMAEIFLQHLEETNIKHLLDTKIITYYTRYVDIFLIYDATRVNPDDIPQYITTIHNNIQLEPTPESNNTTNFLDLTITRDHSLLNL
jgi:hypothetical protein